MGIGDYLGFLFGAGDAVREPEAFPEGDVEVLLQRIGPRKIAVIKVVREVTHLGLAETKRLVESAPTVVARVATPALAEQVVAHLHAVGAVAAVGNAEGAPTGALGSAGERVVMLHERGNNVILVIKVLREHLRCDLRSAKGYADAAPTALPPLPEERALALLMALADAGARADIS